MKRLESIVTGAAFSAQQCSQRRSQIREFVLSQSDQVITDNFASIAASDLHLLWEGYDDAFFRGELTAAFSDPGQRQVRFRLSKRMTSTGGLTTFQPATPPSPDLFEIAISANLLFHTFQTNEHPVVVCGVQADHRLDALQRIFEHELVHLIESLLWRRSSCAQNRFRTMVHRLFGHRESNHQLTTPGELAKAQLGIESGDRVSFEFEGKRWTGFVNRIHRRATVLVPHAKGELYSDRQRYLKFYVPLNRLKRA